MEPTRGATGSTGTSRLPAGGGPCRSYLLLLAIQTAGAALIYWIGIPVYWKILANPSVNAAGETALVWSLSAIVLMQAGYWIRYEVVPALPRVKPNALLGHVVMFVAHLAFDVAVAVFTFVFITRPPEFQLPFLRYGATIAAIFALYCYSLELERLGKCLLETKQEPAAPAR